MDSENTVFKFKIMNKKSQPNKIHSQEKRQKRRKIRKNDTQKFHIQLSVQHIRETIIRFDSISCCDS